MMMAFLLISFIEDILGKAAFQSISFIKNILGMEISFLYFTNNLCFFSRFG